MKPVAVDRSADTLLRNVGFGVLDYLVQPALMLLTARLFIHRLGVEQFGLWMLVLAIVGSSGTLCNGFGDAALKQLASGRGVLSQSKIAAIVQAALAMNFLIAVGVGTVFVSLAREASLAVFHLQGAQAATFVGAVRVGALVLLARSAGFVFTSSLRAFEWYGAATKINAISRIASISAALALVIFGHGVVAIMLASAACEALAVLALGAICQSRVHFLMRSDERTVNFRELVSFGTYSWIQGVTGTIFSQADRVLIATMLGPAALGYYGVCVQASQPIHGLVASAANVLFPRLSALRGTADVEQVERFVQRAFVITLLAVVALALPLLVFSQQILTIWISPDFAAHASGGLSLVALSFVLLAMNIPGHYALMAMGRVRYLAAINLVGCGLALLASYLLIPHLGISGAALGRIVYGPVTWLLYREVARELRRSPNLTPVLSGSTR